MKTVSQLDADGYFAGPVIADKSPLEDGVFLIPAGAVDKAPPLAVEGKRHRPWGAGWRAEDLPAPPVEVVPPVPTAAELRKGEIDARLFELDRDSVRALRETLTETAKGRPAPPVGLAKLDAIETEAVALRLERAAL